MGVGVVSRRDCMNVCVQWMHLGSTLVHVHVSVLALFLG